MFTDYFPLASSAFALNAAFSKPCEIKIKIIIFIFIKPCLPPRALHARLMFDHVSNICGIKERKSEIAVENTGFNEIRLPKKGKQESRRLAARSIAPRLSLISMELVVRNIMADICTIRTRRREMRRNSGRGMRTAGNSKGGENSEERTDSPYMTRA